MTRKNPTTTALPEPVPYAAFRILSNPVEESELWFGVYGEDNLIHLEKVHIVVPMTDKEETEKRLKVQHGENNIAYKGETKFGAPNYIGVARFGTNDIESINFDLQKKYYYPEYVFEQKQIAELKRFTSEGDEILERLEGIAAFPFPLLMQFLENQKKLEAAAIFRTLNLFEASQAFLGLLAKDNHQETSEYHNHCEEITPMVLIQNYRNAM